MNYKFPSERGIPYDVLPAMTKDNIALDCWFLRQPIPDQAPTIIYFHEAAGSKVKSIKL